MFGNLVKKLAHKEGYPMKPNPAPDVNVEVYVRQLYAPVDVSIRITQTGLIQVYLPNSIRECHCWRLIDGRLVRAVTAKLSKRSP